MWYPAKALGTPTEPVSLTQAKRHLNVFHDDDNEYIGELISAAREHAEGYCGAIWAEQDFEVYCDRWSDLVRLPLVPVVSISSIEYVDTDGETQTLNDDTYEFLPDKGSVELKPGQSWQAARPSTRIKLMITAGGNAPAAVRHALLLRIEDFYEKRGSELDGDWSAFDSLLVNHRYYA